MRSTRHKRARLAGALAALAAFAAAALIPLSSTAESASLGQLNSQLGQEQSHQQSLSASISSLNGSISALSSQIALVQQREAAVRVELARDQSQLAATRVALTREQHLLVLLRARLARSRSTLARQLVSAYETGRPDLISVVLESTGFKSLLDSLTYLRDAQHQQQSIIVATRVAKARADAAAKRLGQLETAERQITAATAIRVKTLAGMNALLSGKQAALDRARAAQQSALAASRARGQQLQSEISKAQAAQSAAQQAVTGAGPGPALGPSGGWVIPYAIVMCESGGQNDPPNSAGASGYYQIIPSTWAGFGGTGPAAWLASKAEQDAVASRIWNGGAGWANWDCASIVGIH